MKHVGTHPTHIEASKTLADLNEALVAAQAEANEVQTLLVQVTPAAPAGALARAKSMLSGAPEPQRADLAGLQQRLVVATGKVALLTQAVAEQREVLAALVDAESALAAMAAKAKHIKAVEGIKQALGVWAAEGIARIEGSGMLGCNTGHECKLYPLLSATAATLTLRTARLAA